MMLNMVDKANAIESLKNSGETRYAMRVETRQDLGTLLLCASPQIFRPSI